MPTLEFKGKPFVYSHHLSVPFRELVIDPKTSTPGGKKASLDDNLIIHGDNLEALKALLPRYAGEIDVIYIDPPYNTGNEDWVYNDNVNSPLMKAWLGKVVDRDDLERHDKWCCMMWPRLELLWELLKPSGSIWISCDDTEAHRLKLICDEVFGEEAFVNTVVWQKNYSPKPTVQQFSSDHDYVLVYAKGGEGWRPGLLPRTEQQDAAYKNPDNDPRGPWKPGDFSLRNYYSKGIYPIKTPGGRLIKGPPAGRYWVMSEENLWELHKDKRIWWGEDGNNVPSVKQFLSEVREGRVPQTLWFYQDVGHTQEAKKELFEIMGWDEGGEQPFTTPKPKRLIDRILTIAARKDAIVLDSFAGSGTTAHSVLAANKADGGTRSFILVEVEDYADAITAERVRRVIKGVPKAQDDSLKEGLGGTFTFCQLGDAIELERFFEGKSAPNYEQVARYVVYTATGQSADSPAEPRKDWFVAESSGYRIHLIYKPDLSFMRSNEPHAQNTNVPALDETHIFCANVEVADAVANIKKGLEAEGMGDLSGDIVIGGKGKSDAEEVTVRIRKQFTGKRIMVPRVLHRDGTKKFRDLDYEADVLAGIDFEALMYRKANDFNVKDYDVGKQQTFTVDIDDGAAFGLESKPASAATVVDQPLDRPGLIRRLLDVVPNPWQGARILDDALTTLRAKESEQNIINARLTLVEHIKRDVQEQLEAAAEAIFREKVKHGDIVFKLLAAPLDQLNFEFVEQFTTHVASGDAGAPLLNVGGSPLDRALYDKVFKKDVNGFEADVALYMDGNDAVTWWWRIAARRDWGLQGWMKNKVYPDFLIHLDADDDTARLLVLETKGKFLEGSADTEFKRKFFELLEKAYTQGYEAGEVELFADAPEHMRFRILLEEIAWKTDLEGAFA